VIVSENTVAEDSLEVTFRPDDEAEMMTASELIKRVTSGSHEQ